MKLDHLYDLRKNFNVIALTGRTGSGCSRLAHILSGDFSRLSEGLRESSNFVDSVFRRKYDICKNFLGYEGNWTPYEIIRYVDVLLFYIIHKHGGDYEATKELFQKYFKEEKTEVNDRRVRHLMVEINRLHYKYNLLINNIRTIGNFSNLKSPDELKNLDNLFFSVEFRTFAGEMFTALEAEGYYRTRCFLHWISCNIRSTGDPLKITPPDINNIYSIAILINRLIKARRLCNTIEDRPTKIVIDSLRNSLEIMFFKQRYSAFYMIATKDVLGNAKKRIEERLESKIPDLDERHRVVQEVLSLDEIEYKTNDFALGRFSSPDVENCIQKSDYHIFNLKKSQIEIFSNHNRNSFLTREEQLLKLIALIQHPGLITPSSAERAMQIANTAKLNSGCISRQVGAVITDSNFYVKAIGWNDVAKGHTPCNLRSVSDYLTIPQNIDNEHYSKFEQGNQSEEASYKYKSDKPNNFKDAIIDYFAEPFAEKSGDLNGKNCSFCFKTVHNYYEGEANQVHTRSLHAEENAMLQLTKLGGVGAEGGFLFTTASPCELCSKKAYQLGIKKVFFIDPYPGIAVDQILFGGKDDTQPKLLPFSGAIGTVYHKLYEGFMSAKDENSMILELKKKKTVAKEFKNLLGKLEDDTIKKLSQNMELDDIKVKEIVLAGIQALNKQVE
jgi:deoxycytidylate deaminase